MHWESGISPMAQVYAWQSGSKSVPSLGFSIGSLICNCFFCQSNHWLVVEPYPSDKYEVVSWDDEIPNWMGK